jgi:hypothetical protein
MAKTKRTKTKGAGRRAQHRKRLKAKAAIERAKHIPPEMLSARTEQTGVLQGAKSVDWKFLTGLLLDLPVVQEWLANTIQWIWATLLALLS